MKFHSNVDLFSLAVAEGAEGAPSTLRIPILPEGKFEHAQYGKLDWNGGKFAEMQANFEAQVTGYTPMLNFDHSTHNPFAGTNPAAGWFQRLEIEPGAGLFAVVELTPAGAAAIKNREYRYISGEVFDEYARSSGVKAKNVITGAALTNTPFHDTMPGLFGQPPTRALCFSTTGPVSFWAASEEKKMSKPSFWRKLTQKFNLGEDATDEQVAAALEAAPAVVPDADLNETHTEVQVEPAAATLKAVDFAQHPAVVALTQQNAALAAKIDALVATNEAGAQTLARQNAETLVQHYMAAGKIVPAAQEPSISWALAAPDDFRKYHDAIPARVQFHAGQTNLSGQQGGSGETLETYILQLQTTTPGLPYAAAVKQASAERPELYRAYRATQRGGTN